MVDHKVFWEKATDTEWEEFLQLKHGWKCPIEDSGIYDLSKTVAWNYRNHNRLIQVQNKHIKEENRFLLSNSASSVERQQWSDKVEALITAMYTAIFEVTPFTTGSAPYERSLIDILYAIASCMDPTTKQETNLASQYHLLKTVRKWQWDANRMHKERKKDAKIK